LINYLGTFGKLWLAGTVGVKKRPFNKDVIESSNIDEFILAITNVELPLSPRLSGTFLRGICAIYEQKFHLLRMYIKRFYYATYELYVFYTLELRVQTLFRRVSYTTLPSVFGLCISPCHVSFYCFYFCDLICYWKVVH
jgi:hypothetical protein